MKSILLSICLFSGILFFNSCKKDKITSTDQTTPIDLNATKGALVKNDNVFGFNLFNEINKTESNDSNLFVSPLSVAYALAMTYNGADHDTKTAMETVLNLKGLTVDQINASYKSLLNQLTSLDNKVIFENANSIWYAKGFVVEPEFINVNSTYYNAVVRSLNFALPASKDTINHWVETKTHEKIKTIIDEIPTDAVMFLINSIYFKGIWQYSFDSTNTMQEPFYPESGLKKNVSMMIQKNKIKYYMNDLLLAIELPYGIGQYSMIALLPQSGKTVNNIIDQLTPDNWNTWLNSMHYSIDSIYIHLPKFKFSYEKKLNDVLTTMGMGIAFSATADFTKINKAGQLQISEVKHKSFVEVNEQGTEAAAVTLVAIIKLSMPQDPDFIANKPFLFVIKEKQTNSILFIGKVMNP